MYADPEIVDCALTAPLKVATPDCAALIAEGSYINLPIFRREADVRIFLDAPWETRLARLQRRESPESLQRFFGKWIPLENAYFRAYHLPDEDMIKTEGTV